jgi:small subunit ribosomal protein S4e
LERQGLSLVRIPKDEAKFKLCKVLGKNVAPKGVIQYNTHDGRSIAVTKGEGEPADYAPNDTLRVSIPTQRVLNHIKFEKGNYALVIAGRNQGKSGKIVDIQGGNATRPAMVKIEDPTGSKFDTMVEYTFAVGTDKPAIKLEAS